MPICSVNEVALQEPSDDEINRAYNIFDAEKMKYFKNVFVSLNRDFRPRKTRKPNEWNDFAAVIKLCKANNFDVGCYIKYCFLNRLVPKSKGHMISDISYLKNTPQILAYAREKKEIERLFKIYRSIQKTIFLVKKISKQTGDTTKATIRNILSSGKLSIYVDTGTVSPYFIALIPNAAMIVQLLMNRKNEDRGFLIDLCNRINIYGLSAQKSMSMFYPNSMTKNIIELCS